MKNASSISLLVAIFAVPGFAAQAQEIDKAKVAAAERWARLTSGGNNEAYQRELDSALRLVAGEVTSASRRIVLSTPSTISTGTVANPALHSLPDAPVRTASAEPEVGARSISDSGAYSAPSIFNDLSWNRNFQACLFGPAHEPDEVLRMVGAVRDSENQFQCCLRIAGNGSGSGVLIGPNVVLTAAHVVSPELEASGDRHHVYFGVDTRPGIVKDVAFSRKVIRHPQYNKEKIEHDIALIILDEPVPQCNPLALAGPRDIEKHKCLVVAGYGLTETGMQGIRHKALLFIAENPTKYGAYNYETVAGGRGVDACMGDSGGPCFIRTQRDGRTVYLVAAVVSRGIQGRALCGDGGVEVRVDQHLDWIVRVARENGGKIAWSHNSLESKPGMVWSRNDSDPQGTQVSVAASSP